MKTLIAAALVAGAAGFAPAVPVSAAPFAGVATTADNAPSAVIQVWGNGYGGGYDDDYYPRRSYSGYGYRGQSYNGYGYNGGYRGRYNGYRRSYYNGGYRNGYSSRYCPPRYRY
jgi:hypothetical protein